MPNSIEQQIAETEKSLKFVFPYGSIVELRAKMADGYHSGRFTDFHKAAVAAYALQHRHGAIAVYYGLNPLLPTATHVGCSTLNTVQPKPRSGGCAADRDIERRCLYLIDVDPERPQNVMATDQEREEAAKLAHAVREYLTALGWAEPIVVDSGSGIQMLYRGDGCGPRSDYWRFVLQQLAQQFSTEGASVDTTVFNAARIARLPGTWNRKGPDTADRPHRQSHVLSYPAKWEELPHHRIHNLAIKLGYEEQAAKSTAPGIEGDEDRVLKLIAEYPEMLHYAGAYDRGNNRVVALSSCPFVARAHEGGNSAIVIHADGTIAYNCYADKCPGHGFRSLLRFLARTTGRISQVFKLEDVEIGEREYTRWGMIWDDPDDPDDSDDDNATNEAEAEIQPAVETATEAPEDEMQTPPATTRVPADDGIQVRDLFHSDEDYVAWIYRQARSKGREAKITEMQAQQEQQLMLSPEWEHDGQTYDAMTNTDWSKCELSTDPAEWGLAEDEVSPIWLNSVMDAIDATTGTERRDLCGRCWSIMHNAKAMGAWLGHEWLFTISRLKAAGRLGLAERPMTKREFRAIAEMANGRNSPRPGYLPPMRGLVHREQPRPVSPRMSWPGR